MSVQFPLLAKIIHKIWSEEVHFLYEIFKIVRYAIRKIKVERT